VLKSIINKEGYALLSTLDMNLIKLPYIVVSSTLGMLHDPQFIVLQSADITKVGLESIIAQIDSGKLPVKKFESKYAFSD